MILLLCLEPAFPRCIRSVEGEPRKYRCQGRPHTLHGQILLKIWTCVVETKSEHT